MIGPFDCWTTAKSGESAGVAGADAAGALVSCFEHPVRSAPAEATSVAYPKPLRVMTVGAFGSGVGPQLEQPPEEHVPQELLVSELITTSDFVIAVPFPLNEATSAASRRTSPASRFQISDLRH